MTELAITVYLLHSNVLFCGMTIDQVDGPWFALPVETYGDAWECGDIWCIWADGEEHCAPAWDSGPFGAFCVRQLDGTCPRIAVDVPKPHWWKGDDTSTVARWAYNKTRLDRELAEGIWGWPR